MTDVSTNRLSPCPECGSQRVEVEPHVIAEGSGGLVLIQHGRSSSWWKGKSNRSETVALVCIHCGYTAWYAVTPSNLRPDG